MFKTIKINLCPSRETPDETYIEMVDVSVLETLSATPNGM